MSNPQSLEEIEQRMLDARQGELVRKASRHRIGLNVYARAVADIEGFDPKRKEAVRKGLIRQALRAGVLAAGYDARLKQMVQAFSEDSDAGLDAGLTMFALMEEHGFQFESWRDTYTCIAAFKRMIRGILDDWQIAKENPKISSAVRTLISAFDISEHRLGSDAFTPDAGRLAEAFIHSVGLSLGWSCRKSQNPPAPITSPEVLQSAVALISESRWMRLISKMMIRRGPGSMANVEIDHKNFRRVIMPFHVAHLRGLSEAKIKQIRETHGVGKLLVFCQLVHEHDVATDQFEMLHRAECLGGNLKEAVSLLESWRSAGSPKPLATFKKVGGTQEAWTTHLEEERTKSEHARALAVQGRVKTTHQLSGSGRKRHHASYKGSNSSPGVDFEALCTRVEEALRNHLPDLASKTVAVVLVRGLFRQGDRVVRAQMATADARRIWRNAREDLAPMGLSQRGLRKLLQDLVSIRLLERNGKHLRLNRKTYGGNPAVRKFLNELTNIINSAAV